MNSTFVLFDRQSDSIWYPGDGKVLNAVSGVRKGDSIPVAAESPVMPLREWLELHPDSKILLPTPHSKTVHDLKESSYEPLNEWLKSRPGSKNPVPTPYPKPVRELKKEE